MQFNSYELIFLFLPLTLLGFFLLGKGKQTNAALIWLIVASLLFYNWGSSLYVGLFGVSIFVNYALGLTLSETVRLPLSRRWILILGIFLNLALLGYFKYADFTITSLNQLFGSDWSLLDLALPLGISFFIFSQISYLVDIYQGKIQEEGFLNYALFVSFFPKLIAGPITYYSELIPQFVKAETYRFQIENLAVGLTIFSLGLFKKAVFADSLATYSNPIFQLASEGKPLSFSVAWIGALAFCLQLYFDFSGYSDMAIGAARLFGIQLPLNFNSPYKATKVSQLWNTWHMSLTRFFRDYFFFPISRWLRQFSALRTPSGQQLATYGNTFAVMLIIGLWHGAGWNYLLWGGVNGLYLVVYQLWRNLRRRLGHNLTQQSLIAQIFGWFFTFTTWTIALVLPKTTSLSQAWIVWQGMFDFSDLTQGAGQIVGNPFVNPTQVNLLPATLWVIGCLAVVLLMPNTQEWLDQYRPALDYVSLKVKKTRYQKRWQRWRWQPSQGWAVVTAFLSVSAVLLMAREQPFIYFNF